jgi:hypothetical protein
MPIDRWYSISAVRFLTASAVPSSLRMRRARLSAVKSRYSGMRVLAGAGAGRSGSHSPRLTFSIK